MLSPNALGVGHVSLSDEREPRNLLCLRELGPQSSVLGLQLSYLPLTVYRQLGTESCQVEVDRIAAPEVAATEETIDAFARDHYRRRSARAAAGACERSRV